MEEFTSLIVGEPFPGIQHLPLEGCHYNYDVTGHQLHYIYNDPSRIEIKNFQTGPINFGLYVEGNVIILLHKFGILPWSDSPYSWWRVTPENRRVPWIDPKWHATIIAVLLDQKTRIIRAMRFVTFSKEFTLRLHQAIIDQSQEDWNPYLHEQTIDRIYKMSTEELAKRALVKCRGGETDDPPQV